MDESSIVVEAQKIEVIIEQVTNVIEVTVSNVSESLSVNSGDSSTIQDQSSVYCTGFDIDIFRENLNALLPDSVRSELVKRLTTDGYESLDEFIKKINTIDSKVDSIRKLLGIV